VARITPLALLLALSACFAPGGRVEDPPPLPDAGAPCAYPDPTEPMTLGEVLTPYAWNTARLPDGSTVRADLADAPCGDDPLWSPFDALVFVSIPAW
jgi:hypothetical protein